MASHEPTGQKMLKLPIGKTSEGCVDNDLDKHWKMRKHWKKRFNSMPKVQSLPRARGVLHVDSMENPDNHIAVLMILTQNF